MADLEMTEDQAISYLVSDPEPGLDEDNILSSIIAKASSVEHLRFKEAGGDSSKKGAPKKKDVKAHLGVATTNPWVYACLFEIGAAPSSVPFKLTKSWRPDSEEVESEEIDDFLFRPNECDFYDDFIMRIMFSLELAGELYIEPTNETGDRPEAHVLEPYNMFIIPSSRRLVDGFIWKGGGESVEFKREDIVFSQYPSPINNLYGLSPIQALERDLTAEFYAQAYNMNFFRKGAKFDGVLEAPGTLSKPDFKALKERFWNEISGVQRQHSIPVLQKGINFKPVSMSPKDMEFLQQRKWTREAVLSAMGVPPVMIGIFEYANYANAQVQQAIFWKKTMLPKLKKLQNIISLILQKHFGEGIYFQFETKEIEALDPFGTDEVTSIVGAVGEGLLNRDEGRKRLNMEPLPEGQGGQVYTVAAGKVPLSDLTINLDQDLNNDGIPDLLQFGTDQGQRLPNSDQPPAELKANADKPIPTE